MVAGELRECRVDPDQRMVGSADVGAGDAGAGCCQCPVEQLWARGCDRLARRRAVGLVEGCRLRGGPGAGSGPGSGSVGRSVTVGSMEAIRRNSS